MSTVLPQEARRAVWRMYRARFIIAGSMVAILAALISAIALVPSYLALTVDAGGTPAANAAASASQQQDRDTIIQTQSLLSTLAPIVSATTTPTGITSEALALRPSGVSVDHISYESGTIVLQGSATTREAIDAYRQALDADADFTGVSVPVGDLAGAPGGSFSITLTGNF